MLIRLTLCALLCVGCASSKQPVQTPPLRHPTTQKIAEFQGEYRFLSNFYPAVVEFEGLRYPTAEHAYQAAKTLDMNQRRRISALPTPSEAKSEGRKLALRPDWETAKFDVMQRVVRDKFTRNPELRQKLLDTGDAQLEEGNTWGDRIWGVYQGQGENWLGKILMKVRDELRQVQSAASSNKSPASMRMGSLPPISVLPSSA